MEQKEKTKEPKNKGLKRRRSLITTFLIPFVIMPILVVIVLLRNDKEKNSLEILDMNYDEVQEGEDGIAKK